jgi:hypothetical protein
VQYQVGRATDTFDTPPQVQLLLYQAEEEILKITRGRELSAPPPPIGKPIDGSHPSRGLGHVTTVASDLAERVGTDLVFGYTDLGGPGDEIPVSQRPGYSSDAEGLASRNQSRPGGGTQMPMHARDP